jgi:hypothetical protein
VGEHRIQPFRCASETREDGRLLDTTARAGGRHLKYRSFGGRSLLAAKAVVAKVGSVEAAEETLKTLKKLQ